MPERYVPSWVVSTVYSGSKHACHDQTLAILDPPLCKYYVCTQLYNLYYMHNNYTHKHNVIGLYVLFVRAVEHRGCI